VHLDGLRFLVYTLAVTPAQNLADLLGDEDPLAALFDVPSSEDATMLFGRLARTLGGNKTVYRDYEVAAECVHVDAPGRDY
jgi:hypothetical protein